MKSENGGCREETKRRKRGDQKKYIARFVRRTWRRTSERICLANDIPPGFRIVLLDDAGRVKRDDVFVRSGSFGSYPSGFTVDLFLSEAIKNNVKDFDRLNYMEVELRDHNNDPIDGDLTLLRVRDMKGVDGKHTQAWEDNLDIIYDLKTDIETALTDFEPEIEPRFYGEGVGDPNIVLKALVRYLISRFSIDALEYVFDYYQPELEAMKARRDKEISDIVLRHSSTSD